jgi:hypothetical protein
MNYHCDLLTRANVSAAYFVVAGFILIAGVYYMAIRCTIHAPMQVSEWAFVVACFAASVSWFCRGLGYRFERLLGKAYVRIDDEVFALKPGWQKKATSVLWEDVSGILHNADTYTMRTRDSGADLFELAILDYAVIQEGKTAVEQVAA